MARRTNSGGEVMVATWIQTVVNILAMFGSVFWIYNQVDKRLTILETKMETTAKTQIVYATHYEVTDLQRQIDEMRESIKDRQEAGGRR